MEFADKRLAKRVAATLNGQIIGGKSRDFYHDDLWTMKYVRGLKWDDLTAKIGTPACVDDAGNLLYLGGGASSDVILFGCMRVCV